MVTKQIVKGYLTEDGELKVELPANWQPGEVDILMPVSDEAVEERFVFKGLTAGEILQSGLVGSGADWDIGDSEEYVQEQRRK